MTMDEAYAEAKKLCNKIPNIDELTYTEYTKVLSNLTEMFARGEKWDRIYVKGVILEMGEAKAMNNINNETQAASLPDPVWIYFAKLLVMFGKDPDVELEFERVDDFTSKAFIYVNDSNRPGKSDAFTKMLPSRVDFRLQRLYIEVISTNDSRADHEVLIDMFYGNPIIDSFVTDHSGRHYIVFKKDILQYYANDLSDVNSLQSALAEDLARELITDDITNVYFCTASE